MTDAHPSAGASRDDQKRALLEAAQAAVEDAREKELARRRGGSTRTSRTIVTVLGVSLFGMGIYLLAARPAWFFTPPPAPETMEIREASVRLMLVREAERVKRYRAEHGRFPATLAEAGSPVRGLLFETRGDTAFRVMSPWGDGTIGLSSSDSVGSFLGNSLRIIVSRGRP
jgi:hypothetical protein